MIDLSSTMSYIKTYIRCSQCLCKIISNRKERKKIQRYLIMDFISFLKIFFFFCFLISILLFKIQIESKPYEIFFSWIFLCFIIDDESLFTLLEYKYFFVPLLHSILWLFLLNSIMKIEMLLCVYVVIFY